MRIQKIETSKCIIRKWKNVNTRNSRTQKNRKFNAHIVQRQFGNELFCAEFFQLA